MADPLYDLLRPHLPSNTFTSSTTPPSPEVSRYLSRLVSLHLDDLTTTEPESIAQASQSNLVSIQALSSRSYRTTTTSSDHLSTLRFSLPQLSASVEAIRQSIPGLDSKAVEFASSYNRSKDDSSPGNALLSTRRESALLARQADKIQDILELPALLSAAIASASTGSTATSGANYTQALDLLGHIKRLQILYPDSKLVKSVLRDAETAMKDMTTNLIAGLRGQNIRLAAAIRMIGWLRRVAPELGTTTTTTTTTTTITGSGVGGQPKQLKDQSQSKLPGLSTATTPQSQSQNEDHFGALFLCARLCTFLYMTEALSPLRDLADQETQARTANDGYNRTKAHSRNSSAAAASTSTSTSTATSSRPEAARIPSTSGANYTGSSLQGQHTERYLKRYIEIFREQSFATISMYRNIFHQDESESLSQAPSQSQAQSQSQSPISPLFSSLSLPPALQSFPLHLVEVLMATLKQYLPNVTDASARESLLMQVLYAANSLGRLGADFSMMIALLDEGEDDEDEEEEEEREEVAEQDDADAKRKAPAEAEAEAEAESATTRPEAEVDAHMEEIKIRPGVEDNGGQVENENDNDEAVARDEPEPTPAPEPEWVSVIKKHRIQAARLEALAAGQDKLVQRRESTDIAVR